jgi:DNA polymerase-3 subunit alpha
VVLCPTKYIDSDFEGMRRDEVKAYMEDRFGKNHVCSVGTYGNLKLKMAFTDLSRLQSIPIQEVKLMTSILGDGEKEGTDWKEIFYLASTSDKLKSFIKRYPDIINDSKLCLMQPRSSSIHACATIITPDSKDIFRWFPVKKETNKNGESVLVSEWEGIQLDSTGFLKEDILGILQLDKIANMIKLVHENTGIKLDFRNIPLEDRKTYRYFHRGWNEDVFQFGTKGLKNYTREMKPDSIEELSAANALYRPGAMKSNAHNDYIAIKFGRKEVEYDYMLKDIMKETYGLYIYQEQSMLAAQVLAGFSLVEADILRKVILVKGKKGQIEKKEEYRDKFLKGAVANGCPEYEADKIWSKMEAFSTYGFCKAHAVAYGITGYISQWFKANYPTEFWTTAFKFSSEKNHANYISEINQSGDIKIMSADINRSKEDVYTDFKTQTIYWPLISIKQCGEKAASQLMEDRGKNGQYFSLEEFLDRSRFKGNKLTKQVVENLIMSGAFDEIESINLPRNRYNLILKYRKINKVKVDKEKDIFELNRHNINEDWWWTLQQKRLSGIAFFDYKDILDRYLEAEVVSIPIEDFQMESNADIRKKVKICGYLTECEERNSKKGKWARLLVECNYTFVYVTIWSEQYKEISKLNIIDKEKSLILISGQIVYDSFKKENILQATEDTEIMILE